MEQKFIIHTPNGPTELWARDIDDAQDCVRWALEEIEEADAWTESDIRIEATTVVRVPGRLLREQHESHYGKD